MAALDLEGSHSMTSIEAAMERIGRNWGWILAYGILLVVTGIFAMLNPMATGLAVGLILAVSFFAGGAVSLAAAFRDAGWQSKAVDIVFGILALLAGLICLANPFGGAISIVWVIGVLFLVSGGFEFIAGLRAKHEKFWLILLGICDMLIGFWAVFLMGPGAALVTLATLVGIGFVFRGTLLSVFAFQVRELTKG